MKKQKKNIQKMHDNKNIVTKPVMKPRGTSQAVLFHRKVGERRS